MTIANIRTTLLFSAILASVGSFGAARAVEPVPTTLRAGGWIGSLTVAQGDTLLGATIGSSGVRLVESGGGAPVAGKTITFTAGEEILCTSTTNESGYAWCDEALEQWPTVAQDGYAASFAGDESHAGSSTTGELIDLNTL